jgi:hypothetical protein
VIRVTGPARGRGGRRGVAAGAALPRRDRIAMKAPARTLLVDDAIDAYVDWREECLFVWDAYVRWSEARQADGALAFAAYAAALDREERACAWYAGRLGRLAR